jgi:hypothetical protein
MTPRHFPYRLAPSIHLAKPARSLADAIDGTLTEDLASTGTGSVAIMLHLRSRPGLK